MNHRPAIRDVLALAVSLIFGGLVFIALDQTKPSVVMGYPAPYPPPVPVQSSAAYPPPGSSQPSSTPSFPALPQPLSPQAQTAIAYIADREGIPSAALTIATERLVEYSNLGRQFKLITLLDSRQETFMVFKLLVDLNDGSVEEDIYSLRDAEAQAYQALYGGKLAPTLYTRLQTLDDDDELPVAVWAAAGPGQTMTEQQEAVYAVLAARYPEAQVALERSGTPMDIDDPVLAQQISEEYHILMAERMVQRTQPLIDELEGRGFAIVAYPGMPSFATVLPKSAIIELGQHDDVSAVYLIDAEEQTELDSAAPSSLVPTVWARGYDGTGVMIAILERGNVDWDNSFLNHISVRLAGIDGETDHATGVASAAASFDGTYTGVAPGASILSAGTDGTEAGAVYALWWAIMEQETSIVNYSGGFGRAGNQVEWIDRAFDYWARYNKNLIVEAAGNTGDFIISPGRGWNVLTVGAYNDQNNADWSDDTMRETSAYINPVSDHGDREKPEVVAVGGSITRRGMNDVIDTKNGTSLSAPQVAGLGALLIHRDSMLDFWPEANRAIIMASANHNITGTSIIRFYDPIDERDGAGAINADLADQIAQTFAAPDETCYSSCWWVDFIHEDTVSLERSFYAESGDMIRVAVSWWSHADSEGNDYSFDRLDTDLDLFLQRPDGAYSDISISHDNNYEMVEIMAPQSGLYTIRVDKVGFNEASNSIGIALARFPAPYQVYLALVMKD